VLLLLQQKFPVEAVRRLRSVTDPYLSGSSVLLSLLLLLLLFLFLRRTGRQRRGNYSTAVAATVAVARTYAGFSSRSPSAVALQ
jgi:hypothetical protein